jgi:transcription elongation factor Elf1
MRKVSIELPSRVDFTCPACHAEYSIEALLLSSRETLYCPLCGISSSVYESLHGEVRRRIYHAVRDAIEHNVYEQQMMDRQDYFEDKANLDS